MQEFSATLTLTLALALAKGEAPVSMHCLVGRRATYQRSAISRRRRVIAMAKVVKVIELMSQSSKSWEDAAQGAVDEASKTLRNIRSLYIKEFTVEVDNGKISNYRINAKVTFDLERG
jgi:flavin-binding protein dodecin